MLNLISIAILLGALACQSTGYNLQRPNLSRDKSPGPIVMPTVPGADAIVSPSMGSSEEVPDSPEQAPNENPLPTEGSKLPEVSDDKDIKTVQKPIFLGEADPSKNRNLPYGVPALTSNDPNWIISRPQYVMSWNPQTRNLNWVAWMMNLEQFGNVGRQPNFVVDPDLKEYIAGSDVKAVTTGDYTGLCFDRGHQVASNDRQATQEDNVTTFYTTNIIPQTAFLNQIIWKKLEADIKTWLTKAAYKNLWIVAGPIYGKKLSYTGPNQDIAVPTANFKAIFSWDETSQTKPFLVKAVIMPNVLSNGADPVVEADRRCSEASSGGHIKGEETLSQNVDDYLATIPAIEAAAHIRFPAAVRP